MLRLEALLNAALPGCYVCARARAQVARGVARRLVRGVATALRPRTPRRLCLRAEQETGNGPLQSRSTSDAQDHTFRRRNPPGRCRGCTSWQSDAVQQITTATAARSKRLDGPNRAIPPAEYSVRMVENTVGGERERGARAAGTQSTPVGPAAMSAGGSGSSRSSSAKMRALQYLQKVREASKEIFRNLQTVSKTGRDEPGGAEKTETLRSQRENFIKLLCSFQSELHESVGELKQVMECKRKMTGMRTKIDKHEEALRTFGKELKAAEKMLGDALKRSSHEGHASASGEPVELDVDELIRYSHVISYTTSAQDGWEPNTTLTGALPPAPQSEMMARSRLFDMQPSGPPSAQAPATRRHAHSSGEADLDGPARADVPDAGLGKRGREAAEQSDDDEMLKIWSHPLLSAEDSAALDGDGDGDEMQPPQKRQAWVQPQAACIADSPGKDKTAHERQLRDSNADASVSENAAANLRPDAYIELPKMPSWWRPGMPVLVAAHDKPQA